MQRNTFRISKLVWQSVFKTRNENYKNEIFRRSNGAPFLLQSIFIRNESIHFSIPQGVVGRLKTTQDQTNSMKVFKSRFLSGQVTDT